MPPEPPRPPRQPRNQPRKTTTAPKTEHKPRRRSSV
jgi:hypothetical protein